MVHQRQLYETTDYKELYAYVNGFSLTEYLKKNEDTKLHDKFNNKLLREFNDNIVEFVEITDRAKSVYALANDEARLRRLFIDISDFVDRRPDLFI